MENLMQVLQKPLDVKDIEFRVGEIRGKSVDSAWATILAYKNARVDMKRLDEATGGLWQNEYKRDSQGVLQCGIGIKMGDEWVWKWSNGTESQFEKEKGEYSDAFKRAGFMWGIGRELYEFPLLLAQLNSAEVTQDGPKLKATFKFKPNNWTWTMTDTGIIAKDKDGVRLTAKI